MWSSDVLGLCVKYKIPYKCNTFERSYVYVTLVLKPNDGQFYDIKPICDKTNYSSEPITWIATLTHTQPHIKLSINMPIKPNEPNDSQRVVIGLCARFQFFAFALFLVYDVHQYHSAMQLFEIDWVICGN